MANFKNLTRYTNGNTTKNRDGKDFLVLRKPLNIEKSEGDVTVVIDQSLLSRPDLISFKAYKTPDLWWAIYEFNGIRDPLFDLRIGQSLIIPKLENVLAAIDKIGTV